LFDKVDYNLTFWMWSHW